MYLALIRYLINVALRKESVDRNIARGQLPTPEPPSLSARRAWIEIVGGAIATDPIFPSLSARRAWIEISAHHRAGPRKWVALRKESVDRNAQKMKVGGIDVSSLSARRAWIEIGIIMGGRGMTTVALRKESVDRNRYHRDDVPDFRCRSPQGERG